MHLFHVPILTKEARNKFHLENALQSKVCGSKERAALLLRSSKYKEALNSIEVLKLLLPILPNHFSAGYVCVFKRNKFNYKSKMNVPSLLIGFGPKTQLQKWASPIRQSYLR